MSALPPAKLGSASMVSAADCRVALENCKIKAELSSVPEVRALWLTLRESYALLLQAEEAEISARSVIIGHCIDDGDDKVGSGQLPEFSTNDRLFPPTHL